jgi:Fur family ferric uptake transcriptional regulator
VRDVIVLFEKFLETRGLRLTRQRGEILRAMYATHKHISADDLYDLLRKHDKHGKLKISRATVYRTLSLLSEGGFIQALDLGTEQGTLYEHVLGHDHHDHMICLTCGRIIEFMDDELERIQDEAVARHGFQISWHRLNVYGTCKACVSKGAQAPEQLERSSESPE